MNNTNKAVKRWMWTAVAAAAQAGGAAAQAVPPSYKANPEIYKVVAEDERYIVMEVTWKPGQRDTWHAHPKGLAVYFLTDCSQKVTTPDGKAVESKRKAGEIRITPPVQSHTFENTGTSDCKHIHVEAK